MNRKHLQLTAVVVMLGIAAAVGGMLHFGGVLRHMTGVTAIAVYGDPGNGGKIAIWLADELNLLDAAGNFVQRIDTSAYGFVEPISGIAFFDADTLLVAGDTGAPLRACHLPDMACDNWRVGSGTAPLAPMNIRVDGDFIWISESDAHRVHLFSRDGARHETSLDDAGDNVTAQFLLDRSQHQTDIESVTTIKGIVYPHGIVRNGDNLFIANTGRQEILRVPVEDDRVGVPTVFADHFRDHNTAQYRFPLQIAADGAGGLWATVADLRYSRSTLLQLDANGAVTREIHLPDAINPRALQSLGAAVLVGDREVPFLWRVAADGTFAPFGGEAFQKHLASLRATQTQAARLYDLLIGVLVLLVIAVVIVALLDRRARLQGAAGTPADPKPVVDPASPNIPPALAALILLPAGLFLGYVVMLAFSMRTAVLFVAAFVVVAGLALVWQRIR